MKSKLILLVTAFLSLQGLLSSVEMIPPEIHDNKIVTSTKKIRIKNYAGAFNPSIVKFKDGYLMSFRWSPNPMYEHWISYIGLVLLDSSFDPISTVDILETRQYNNATPSQAEDGRIFYLNDKLYVIYNDNMELTLPNYWERRDMHIAEIVWDENNKFDVLEPLRLTHQTKYRDRAWQKNWNPFVWNDHLYLIYGVDPHEIIFPDLVSGICKPVSEVKPRNLDWDYGTLRSSTPAQLVDGEYLSFCHSGIMKKTEFSSYELWHFHMGAYTFQAHPPFAITKISAKPLESPDFYSYSSYDKRVVYPGGYIIDGPNVYLVYGKDDCEIWVATIDLAELKKSLVEVK